MCTLHEYKLGHITCAANRGEQWNARTPVEKSRALFMQTANIQKIVWASVSFQKRRNRLFSTIDVLFGFGRVSSL